MGPRTTVRWHLMLRRRMIPSVTSTDTGFYRHVSPGLQNIKESEWAFSRGAVLKMYADFRFLPPTTLQGRRIRAPSNERSKTSGIDKVVAKATRAPRPEKILHDAIGEPSRPDEFGWPKDNCSTGVSTFSHAPNLRRNKLNKHQYAHS